VENPQLPYTLVRVTRVQEATDLAPEKIEEFSGALRRLLAQEAMAAYLAGLKQQIGVQVNTEVLERREEAAPPPAPVGDPDRPAPRRRGGF
jgi:hypothetical protein